MLLELRRLPVGHSPLALAGPGAGFDLDPWFQPGGDVTLTGDVERRGDQVTVRGRAGVDLTAACARCAGPVSGRIETDLLVVADRRGSDAPEDEAALEGEGAILYHDGLELELRDSVREALILAVPAVFLCREDCRGLCPRCGQDLNEADCRCPRTGDDARWQALERLKDSMK